MKFPFRIVHADVAERLLRNKEHAERRASDAEGRARRAESDYGKRLEQISRLADDMKLIGVHAYNDYERKTIVINFHVTHEQLWYAMRGNIEGARDMMAYMIERELIRNQDTRKAYYGA